MKARYFSLFQSNLRPLIVLAFPILFSFSSLHAASQSWDGGAVTNNLNDAANWTADTLPAAAGDTATWGAPFSNLSLIWNTGFGNGTTGVNLNIASGYAGTFQLNQPNQPTAGNYLAVQNITLSGGSGFTLGGTTGTDQVVLRGTNVFTNDTATAATIAADVSFASGGGIARTVLFSGTGNWDVYDNLALSGTGSIGVSKLGAGTLTMRDALAYAEATSVEEGIMSIDSAATSTINNVLVNGGSLKLANGNLTINSTDGASAVARGTFEVTGGTLRINGGGNTYFPLGGDTTAGNASFSLSAGEVTVANFYGMQVGWSDGSTGALTISNAAKMTVLANGYGIVIGENGTATGTVNLNGGILETSIIRPGNGPGSKFYFNGGTFRPTLSNDNWFVNAPNLSTEIRTGGAVVDTAGFNVTIAETIVNSTVSGDTPGGLSKLGTGTLTLSAPNTYTGATSVTAGTLKLTGSLTSSVSVAGGASFGGTGSTTGSATFATGSSLLVDQPAETPGFTSAGATFSGAAELRFATQPGEGQTYEILNYGAGTVTGFSNLVKVNRGTLTNDTGARKIIFTAGSTYTTTWTGGSGTWKTGAVGWTNGDDNRFWNGDFVYFDDPSAASTITLAGALSPGSVTVTTYSKPYTFTGSGFITGPTMISKEGEGLLTIETANTHTGGTFLQSGTITLAGNGKLGAATSPVFISSGTLNFGTTTQTFGNLTMSEGMINLGGGTQTAAAVSINGGSIQNGTLAGTSFTANTTAEATSTLAANFNGPVFTKNGAGTVVLSGTGTSTLTNFAINEGLLKLTSGTVTVASTAGNSYISPSGNIEVSGGSMTIAGANSWFTLGGTAGQTSTVKVTGGSFTIANTYGMPVGGFGNGVLTVSGGKVRIATTDAGYAMAVGESAGSKGIVNLDGGTLEVKLIRPGGGADSKFYFNGGTLSPTFSTATWFTYGDNLSTEIRTGGAIIDTAGFDATIADVIGNSTVAGDTPGSLTKRGAGALTLSALNTYTGATTVSAGALLITGDASAATGTVTVASGGTLGGTGRLGGSVSVQTGGRQAFAIATLPANQATRTIAGSLTLAAGNILDLTAAAAPANGSYILLTAEGGITGTPGTVNLTGATGLVTVEGNSLVLTVGAVGNGYASWAAGFPFAPGVNNGPGQDPDGDGIKNLLEYVLGGVPIGTGAANTSVLPTQSLNATDLVLTFRRSDLSESDAVVKVQWSDNLTVWNDFATIGAGGALPAVDVMENTPTAELDTVVVRIPRSTSTTGKLFARIAATVP